MNALTEKIIKLESLTNHQVNKDMYGDQFDRHIHRLISIDFLDFSGKLDLKRKSRYNLNRYIGLTQGAFENSEQAEAQRPLTPNIKEINSSLDQINSKLSKFMANDDSSEELSFLKKFTLDSIHLDLLYSSLYPDSISNPWSPTSNILTNSGIMFHVTDNTDLLREFIHGRTKSTIDAYRGNIGIIAKSKFTGKKGINGFVVDSKYYVQTVVFDYLKTNAKGVTNKKTQDTIRKFLREFGNIENKYINQLQEEILVDLKKTGLIGSTGKGFFYITNKEDLLASCKFHMTKVRSIRRILNKYRLRNSEFDIDIDTECIE